MFMHVARFALLAGALAAPAALPAHAQEAPPTSTPKLLLIYREEVKPGHGPAHSTNEAAWAAAFGAANAPIRWLGMTTVAGPSEAWFLSGFESYDALQKVQDAVENTATLSASDDKFSSQEADHLLRTSTYVAGYRPGLSYQPGVNLPQMRYLQVDVVRVKAGHEAAFREGWRMQVEAHTKAKVDEHWATYEVEAGAQGSTFFFLYPHASMAGLDKVGPMHAEASYRDAVGEAGRARMRDMQEKAIETDITYLFKFRPAMSVLTKAWIDADPGFWTVKAPAAAAPVMTAKKK